MKRVTPNVRRLARRWLPIFSAGSHPCLGCLFSGDQIIACDGIEEHEGRHRRKRLFWSGDEELPKEIVDAVLAIIFGEHTGQFMHHRSSP